MAALTHFCRAWREGRREVTQVRKQNSCTREPRNLNYSSAVACLWMFCYSALSLGFLRMECGVWQRKGFIFSTGAFCRVPPAKMCASLANRDAKKQNKTWMCLLDVPFFSLSESFLQEGSESSRFFFFFSWTLYKFYVLLQSENWQIRTCEEKLLE